MAATKPRCSCRPSTRGAPGPTARTIATRIYGADGVEYPKKVDRQIAQAEALGYGRLPVCVAKTQRSLAGDITTMPGLPRKPNAEGVDVTPDGVITGLF